MTSGDIQLTESQQRVLMALADAERDDRTPCTGDLVRELGMTAEEVNDAMDVLADFRLADSVREPDQESDDEQVGCGQTMCDLHTPDGDYCNAPVTVYALYANDDDNAGFAGYCCEHCTDEAGLDRHGIYTCLVDSWCDRCAEEMYRMGEEMKTDWLAWKAGQEKDDRRAGDHKKTSGVTYTPKRRNDMNEPKKQAMTWAEWAAQLGQDVNMVKKELSMLEGLGWIIPDPEPTASQR